ncbi:hypothetical protein BKA59DRAFT_487711 [Fusarium tricinctum]|uniref:Uncharacterized protein n=1 Tax=Fusarium tricinctum TaxID=61284 RepID=A0A8K0RKU7_9HYPO|nr:hypothetical protein BKA59DRAFT_487711 [Fusarium tricinctum]
MPLVQQIFILNLAYVLLLSFSKSSLYLTSILRVDCSAISLQVITEADRTADERFRHRNMTRAIPFIARKAPIPNNLNFRHETERASCPLIE